jgi:multiple sugar transport system ATP-binding protein
VAQILLDNVTKVYAGGVLAVDHVSLEIEGGEFLVLVGPSGCGKTTSLRMLAGFERPTYGTISIDGQVVNTMLPKDRNIAMVFQSYALYPHMNVFKNLAFGMKVRRESRATIRSQVEEVARLLGIDDLLDRRPAQLSGGQRQRVALGRALLRHPRAFLMDEPLSNLDAALRVQMRVELKRLHERLGVTTVYVTHDQVEAMTMGDRIAIMNFGRLQQVDTPERLFERPANLFVAAFIGSPKMNLVPAELTSVDGRPSVSCFRTQIALNGEIVGAVSGLSRRQLVVGVRPEDLRWERDAPASCTVRLPSTVEVVEPLGSETYVVARLGELSVTSRFPPRSGVKAGMIVELALDPAHLHVFDARTETNVLHTPGTPARSDEGPTEASTGTNGVGRSS